MCCKLCSSDDSALTKAEDHHVRLDQKMKAKAISNYDETLKDLRLDQKTTDVRLDQKMNEKDRVVERAKTQVQDQKTKKSLLKLELTRPPIPTPPF